MYINARKILMSFFILMFFFWSNMSYVCAYDYSDSNAADNAYQNNNGTVIFPKGCRSRWSGFLIYIVNENAELMSEVKTVVSLEDLPKTSVTKMYTRLGGGEVDLTDEEVNVGIIWGYPPFDENGNACGEEIRDWMLMENTGTGYNLYAVITEYFIEDNVNILEEFIENDWYLIVEPFFWFMYYEGYDASGFYICDTAKGIAETENYLNSIYNVTGDDVYYGPRNFRRYTNNNFPNSCRFAESQFGIPVLYENGKIKSGILTNNEIIENAYGIMSFWAGSVDDAGPENITEKEENPDTGEEWMRLISDEVIAEGEGTEIDKDGLYYISNKAVDDAVDISDGISPGEYVENYYEAVPLFLDNSNLSIMQRNIRRKEVAKYIYKWPNMVNVQVGSKWISNWQTCPACLGEGEISGDYEYERKQCNSCGIIVKAVEWGMTCPQCEGYGELRDISHWHEPSLRKCSTCNGNGYLESGSKFYKEICLNEECGNETIYEHGYMQGDTWGEICYSCQGKLIIEYEEDKDKACGACAGNGYICSYCGNPEDYTTHDLEEEIECTSCNGSGLGNIIEQGYYLECDYCKGKGEIPTDEYYVCNGCGEKNPAFQEIACSNSDCENGWYTVTATDEICEDCNGTGRVGPWFDVCDALGCDGGIIHGSEYRVQCPDCKGSGTQTIHNDFCDASTASYIRAGYEDCGECDNGESSTWIEPVYAECAYCNDGYYMEVVGEYYECNSCGSGSEELYSGHYTNGLLEECYICYGSGIFGVEKGKAIYCSICKGEGRLCEVCSAPGCNLIEPDYEIHGCMDCGGDFFCEINGIDYCDGNHDMTCFGTGLVYPPIEEKGYFDKCELCNATGFLDACEYCRNGNFTILPAGGSVECGLCKSNKGTEHEGMYDAGYAEPIYELKQDDKMPFIQKEELIEVEAELRYQYINRIALYKLKTFSVLNKALEKEMFIYENPLESIGEVCATAVVYTGDEDDFERAEILLAPYGVQGVDLSAGEHYYFANLEDKVIECASEVEYKNRLETDRNKAAEFIYKNSWSRNDYLSVVLDDNEYMFLDNTKVNGCIIEKNQYLTTAADSEYAYGYACECADIDDINSMRLISETSILSVKEEADTEALYTTAIEAEVELCMGMVSAKGTGQTLYSGKSYYGNKADNIYNHVMYREGYGINHNGGDPDDGYNIVVAEPIEPCVIVRNNDMTKETKPSGQLVDVMDTDYQLLLDSFYYIQISENINEDKYAKSKFIKFPFTLNYNGIYYYTRSDGYTDWIEIEKPKNYLDEWNLSNNEYVSNNHWQMMPIYIPAWAEETDTTDNLPPNIIIKVIDKKHKEYVAESSVQVSGIIYGFTVTGISDISQYKGIADKDVMFNIVYPAVLDKLEWVSGGKNRFGDNAYRYLLDGSLEYNVESWQTLPIRKGSGDGNNTTKSGSGELSKGTSFNYIIRTIANMTGENDYIEIVPRFKYVMEDGSVINDEDLIIIYNLFSDTYVVAGSEKEKQLFGKMSEDLKSGNAEYISCMLAPSLGDDGYKGILDFSSVKSRYLTNIFGYINIPNELRVLCGETKELSVNRFNEPEELLSEEDMNMDGITDEGFNNDSFRTSMQMWFGSYKIWEEFYCVDKRMYPDFFEEGVPVNLNDDERILTNGKLVIGFEIIAYKNGKKHLVYADMWQTEGQECYTVSEYMNDVMGDEVMIDYGDVAVVDTSKKLSDSKDTGIYIID